MKFHDRVHETSTTTGTGDFTLAGAATGKVTFTSRFATNERFAYCIQGATTEWEVGIGYLSGSTTLVRETVLASSNSDAAVNFSSGSKDVFNTPIGYWERQRSSRGGHVATMLGMDSSF
jgi:hypothetical protein